MTLGLRRVTITNAVCVPTFKTRIYYASGHVLFVNAYLFCKLKLQIAKFNKNASDYVVINKSLKIHFPFQNAVLPLGSITLNSNKPLLSYKSTPIKNANIEIQYSRLFELDSRKSRINENSPKKHSRYWTFMIYLGDSTSEELA